MLKYNTRSFTYSKTDNTFVTEASDIGFKPEHNYLELESAKTGSCVVCQFVRTEYGAEGDITCWLFHSTDPNRYFKVIIFND